jgi:leucyl aminopeptidase
MAIAYKISFERPAKAEVEVLVIPLQDLKSEWLGWPTASADMVKKELRRRGWQAKWSLVEILADVKIGRTKLVAVIGLGQNESVLRQQEAMRRGIASVVSEAGRLGLKTLGIDLLSANAAVEFVSAAVEGIEMVSYGFTAYSRKLAKKQKDSSLEQAVLLCREEQASVVRRAIQYSSQLIKGVELARDLVNKPAGDMSPVKLAREAQGIARRSKFIKVDILNRERARREKFNAFLAVAGGSAEEPYVIHLKYVPTVGKKGRKKIWIIGKGITFDSGGLSIKPAEHMESMKSDMAGAAAVLGLFAVLERMALDVEVHGLIAACENMPSGTAYRPGDVLTALNGKTIEVLNTDAEGRITLADALSFAAKSEPSAIIDLATLTGACLVALGETVAGLWSNNEELKQKVVQAANQSGERVETMPMPEEYESKLDSPIADMQNISSSRYGGAISAAMFLREFVGDVPWAHLDIAGPSYVERRYLPYWNRGATGYGVRLLVSLLEDIAAK